MRALLLLVTAGCGNPVDKCRYFPETDCCGVSGQCFDFYGSDEPYCNRPDQDHGGICAECRDDGDCKVGWQCYVHGDGYAECIDPSGCYENTPFTFTSCR